MKFSVEIDIDWINEDSTLDDEINERIISELTNRLERKFLQGAAQKVALSAEKLITAKTELLINTVLEKPVTISDGFRQKQEFDSIFDMVEYRMTSLYKDKIKSKGTCKEDPFLASVNNYTERAVNKLIRGVETLIEKHSNLAATKAVESDELIKKIRSVVGDIK